jgi:hypothetical protein
MSLWPALTDRPGRSDLLAWNRVLTHSACLQLVTSASGDRQSRIYLAGKVSGGESWRSGSSEPREAEESAVAVHRPKCPHAMAPARVGRTKKFLFSMAYVFHDGGTAVALEERRAGSILDRRQSMNHSEKRRFQ